MFKPKKQLGQNFLINDSIVTKIVETGEITPDDTVIEVGPGTGILTEELVKTGAAVLAIEKDFDLITKLKRNIGEPKNIKIIHQDALWFDLSNLEKYKVVANIPYNITSPLIRKFLEGDNKPELMVLTIQKEVAERITAKPGSSERGLLTIIVEFYADAEIILDVPRKNFYPVPKVDSAIIKIISSQRPLNKDIEPKMFFKIVKAGFASKRRQIHNSLAATFHWTQEETKSVLTQAKINSTDRAEDLTLQNWLKLYDVLKNKIDKI
ncbi:MAG: 16S rRNA (adenine(1518)-N(6)/adenine(1519)-N(6))-dimethyltransferase RsmA [Patescibacteria group bacterium]